MTSHHKLIVTVWCPVLTLTTAELSLHLLPFSVTPHSESSATKHVTLSPAADVNNLTRFLFAKKKRLLLFGFGGKHWIFSGQSWAIIPLIWSKASSSVTKRVVNTFSIFHVQRYPASWSDGAFMNPRFLLSSANWLNFCRSESEGVKSKADPCLLKDRLFMLGHVSRRYFVNQNYFISNFMPNQ